MKKLTLGVAATRRDMFDLRHATGQKDAVLKELARLDLFDVVDIDDVAQDGLLVTERDLEGAVGKFTERGVDGVFFPHANFGTEFLVGMAAKRLNVPVLIWGPIDDAPNADGTRTRDTQCGLFATGKVLRRFGVPFTYITNCRIEELPFQSGIRGFAAVCGIVRAFRNLRILQISTRPAPFWTMMVSEGELLERFGIQVLPITLPDVGLRMEALIAADDAGIARAIRIFEDTLDCAELSKESLTKLAALKLAVHGLAREHGVDAVTIQCWSALQDMAGVMPCAVNGFLADEGVPVLCESDIHGAISWVMLREAVMGASNIFFADLTTRHPTNPNAELLWHCGNFPPSLKKPGQKGSVNAADFTSGGTGCPAHANFQLKDGPITLCRFDGDNGEYKLLMGEGASTEGPMTLGTYVWFEARHWPEWEHKLVTGPYVHHIAGAFGRGAAALYEACKYIPHLTPDPTEPSREQIEKYWIYGE